MKHLHTYGFVLAALLASGCASTGTTTSKTPVTDAEKLRAAAATYGQTITAADLSKHLTIIASVHQPTNLIALHNVTNLMLHVRRWA